jgi:hypothetical protein
MFVTTEADWQRLVVGQRESETLDFKSGVTAKKGEIALDVAAFANAYGGVLAYGAIEGERDGVKVAVGCKDIGPPEPHVSLIEDAVHTHLYGVDPKPQCLPLRVAGDRVLIVNVPASARLVGYHDTSERERVRYPVRVGTDRRYLRPDEVERRTLSFPARVTQLRIMDLLSQGEKACPLYLLHLTHISRADGLRPQLFLSEPDVVALASLNAWGAVVQFSSRQQGKAEFEIPYDWIVTVWKSKRLHEGTLRVVPGLLVSATLHWSKDTGVDGIPMPWRPR